MNQGATRRWVLGASIAVLLAAAVSGLRAAPTTHLDDTDSSAPARNAESGVVRPLAPALPGIRSTDRARQPEASTGDKNLDRLLELQGRPGEEARPVAPRSAAAGSAAAAALADLRARAAERPAPERATDDAVAARPDVQVFEGMGTVERDALPAQQAADRRQWTGGPTGGGAGDAQGRDGYRAGDRESDILRGADSDDNLLRRLPKEIVVFLRDNRYWLLGALAVIAMLGAAIKAYSRRI